MPTRRKVLGYSLMAAGASLLSPWLWAARKKEKAPPKPAAIDIAGSRSLKAHAAAAGLLTGFAVEPELLELDGAEPGFPTEDTYTRLVRDQASILVAENAMKWRALRPSLEQFDFKQADRLMQFADKAGQKVRGHNLVWHESLPDWFEQAATKQNARALLTTHISTVVARYVGRMHSWDVVNEAIDAKSSRPDSLRESPWLQLIGPEYIELAFQTAAAIDPSARLTYNDYGIELDTADDAAKRGQVLLLLRRLKARGVPLHAVGIQSHLHAGGPAPGEGLRQFVRELAEMNLEVYITEMDVNDRKLNGDAAGRDAAVAELYAEYLRLLLPEPNVTAFLTWGVTDSFSWLNSDKREQRGDGQRQRPLLFDEQLQPKSAFFACRDALDGRSTKKSTPVLPGGTYEPLIVPGSPGAVPSDEPEK